MKKIAIIGSGALATSFGKVLKDAGNSVQIYGIDNKELEELKKGKNTKYFPETIKLPNFDVTNNIEVALKDANYIVIATPSVVVDKVMPLIIKFAKDALLIIGSKGFYPGTTLSLHEGIKNETKKNETIRGVVSLIGPSHAEEIVLEAPTTVAAVDTNIKLCNEVQKLVFTDYFKAYAQTDVIGAEVGAAYKNILAIASGLTQGMGYGINTTAALLTRGMVEMRRYNKFAGGQVETLAGLTGFGDIIVTATSDLSRNFTLGKKFAKEGKKAMETNITVEGVSALKNIYKIGKENKLDLPIVNFLYAVLFDSLDPKTFVKTIWNRGMKSE